MIDSGIFKMKTAAELLRKLLRDYEHLKANPVDSDGWFNFVVTADHLPEWEAAGDEAAAARLRDREPILRICNHLSRNAKHFRAKDHRVIKGTVLLNPVNRTTEVHVVTLGEPPLPAAPPATPPAGAGVHPRALGA